MLQLSIVIYFLVTLGVGFYASRRVNNAGDFINAGRNLHPALNTAALFALWFGSETVFGASSEFASHGFIGVIEDPLGGVLCLLLVGLFFSRRLYALNVYTIGDLFRKNYGPKIEMFSSALMIVSFVGYAAAQVVALGLISQSLMDISLQNGMLISISVVVLYTFTGGMWAVSVTDFIQSILIVVGLMVVAWYVTDITGGILPIANSLTPEQTRFFPENNSVSWLNWLSAWMVLGFGSIASQDIFQRINSARSNSAAFYSTIFGAILYLIFSMLPLYLITATKLIDPSLMQGDLQLALPRLVLMNMPMWVQILFFGSLLSAIMSTCSGALLAPASLLSENIIKPLQQKIINDKRFLLYTRLSVIIIGLSAYFLALSSQNIFDLVGESSVIGLVTIFIPFVATLFFGHTNKLAAISSMLLGTIVYIIFRVFTISEINPLFPGFIASIAGLGLGQVISVFINKKGS
ncbi:MAG: sodium:solute symporter family protein [Saprospiraceae bacterium]|nr:sodium:solute symporter family protein [Saprospiraceae bacterium]MBP6446260.1 sodium:solute symporter family protein [Saprospiraceae bacterium]